MKAYDTGFNDVGVVIVRVDDVDDDDDFCDSMSLYVYYVEDMVIIKGQECT